MSLVTAGEQALRGLLDPGPMRGTPVGRIAFDRHVAFTDTLSAAPAGRRLLLRYIARSAHRGWRWPNALADDGGKSDRPARGLWADADGQYVARHASQHQGQQRGFLVDRDRVSGSGFLGRNRGWLAV